ncbi:hypothetical protein HNQ77_000672 [Silvibacterium bohemicum]|uniref:Uncharacterized protein n=1 Tax=Silvibacterium bohemicum TaxID=1577686 RepID=A0A841JXM4_9BACT|nr:hypothetical protein [Silvibacterium bohemicum]MBB6142734.1 hypothetical protein [Silvibacterium bohemicum]
MPATSSAEKKRRAPARRKKKKLAIGIWWPPLVGIIVTPFAIHAASILALEGPQALRLLYPYVVLVKEPVIGLSNDLGNNLSQGLLYAQFPLYGLLMALILRFKHLAAALGTVIAVHALGIGFLLLLTYFHTH